MRPSLFCLLAVLVACRGESFQGPSGGSGAGGSGASGSSGGSGGEASGAGGAGAGGMGGTGGSGPTHQAVTLRYGNVLGGLPMRTVVIHDAAGIDVELTETDTNGEAEVSVPIGGFVTVLDSAFEARNVFTAQVLEGVTQVRFHQSQSGVNPNPSPSGPFTGACQGSNCAGMSNIQVHRSCEAPILGLITASSPTVSGSGATNGCADTTELVVTIIVASYEGFPTRYGIGSSNLPAVPASIPLPVISATELTTMSTPIDDLVAGWEASRSIQARDPVGRLLRDWPPNDAIDPTKFHLIDALATNLLVQRGATNDAPEAALSIKRYDNVTLGDVLPAFGLGSLALPNPPEAPLLTTPAQPLLSWSLGAGPIGQMMILGVNDTDGSLSNWEVHVPADSSGSVLLPKLPAGDEFEDYNLGVADIAFYAHVDIDDGSYADAVASGVGLLGLPRNAPSFTVGSTIGQLP